jgi:hypothetical protein
MDVTEGTPRSYAHPRLKLFRRLLGLPATPPNITGGLFIPIDGKPGIGGRMGFLSAEERALEAERYHAEGFRARLATFLAYVPQRARHRMMTVKETVRQARAARALARARVLRYTSPYIHAVGDLGVEGYFDLGNNLGFGLEITTATAMERYAADEWERGGVIHAESSLLFGPEPWVAVPGTRLTDELIREAIVRWYQDRFHFVQGHWSQREHALPEIVVDLHWQTDEERRAEEQLRL